MGSGGKALLQHGPILATKKHCKVRTRCLWATARSPRGDKAPKEPHFSVEQAQISTARAGDRIVFLGAKATIWHQKGHCSIFSGKLTFRFTRDVISKPFILSRVPPGHFYHLSLDISPPYFPIIFGKNNKS